MVNPHQDNGVPWSPKPPTTTTSVNTTNVNFGYNNSGTGQINNNQNVNQVSPGHPGGGYNPNQNQINNNIIQTTTDPNDEKGDYMDWNYVNPDTGKTAAQMAAEAELAAKKKEQERIARMQEALDLKDKYGDNLNKWSDKDLLQAQELGLFTHEAEGVLGGVSGAEAAQNSAKRSLINKYQRLQDQMHQGAWGTDKKSAYETMMNRLKESDEWKSLGNLFGGGTLGAVNAFGVDEAIKMGLIDPNDPATIKFQSTTTGDVGYDPSGVNTWADTEKKGLMDQYYGLTGGELSADELRQYLPSIGYTVPPNVQGDGGFNFRPRMSQRERNSRLLQFLNAGLPIKQLEQSGFYNEGVKSPYAADQAKALQEGIFKGTYGQPGQGGISGEAMKRLLKTFASGYSSPRYANVARGGIMSAWNDMRR